ncbi:ABC transporter ATP-binding protein [uncultured Deefgea sp.]|uniref:ABC transporter ATP-binding protein n=1 Tax=uncultured Deefgea sp. TaxID=1304914 RepID=UPI0025917407|nr:ABC transporter ATP-binding protein [uncultured Deefgea sp.]
MYSDVAIAVNKLSKCYQVYEKPSDRLKQMLSMHGKKFYKEFWALKEISFEIKKGETVGIVGRNGSGKSTLLQMICGTVTPTTGSVLTNGRVAALLELGAGFNTEFTGRENVFLNAAILGVSRSEIESRMEQIIEFSELKEFLDQPVKTYSSGMFSRLAFSIAIHVDPDILIVDEALAVGDARFVAKCMRKINEIKQKGTTIVFVSHDITSVRMLCERVIWLDAGKFIEDGDVFPVSGRYMAYMFEDDKTAEEKEEIGLLASTSDNVQVDFNPVTHWGSHKGIINSAQIDSSKSINKDVISWMDDVTVTIDVTLPDSIDRSTLSLAFSIKDLKGNDLVVATTHDSDVLQLPIEPRFVVEFNFKNYLLNGKYVLVAAVEKREQSDIYYYEYLEGAQYFASVTNGKYFGVFHPIIKQSVFIK